MVTYAVVRTILTVNQPARSQNTVLIISDLPHTGKLIEGGHRRDFSHDLDHGWVFVCPDYWQIFLGGLSGVFFAYIPSDFLEGDQGFAMPCVSKGGSLC